jgi:tetratricopeptide (TPR) repeat protein
VLGRRFTRPLLAEVADATQDVDAALRELRRADLVREGRRWPEEEYRFRHHLILEATYGSLLRRRRAELHRRAAEAIEAAFADRLEERIGVLARHWRHAGELERAFEYHARAGAAAWGVVAPKEALDQYTAALDAAAELGMADPRVREVRMERGRVRFFSGDVDGGAGDVEAALDDARGAGDRETEIRALTYLSLLRHGGYNNAVALAEQAVAIARELGDRGAEVNALSRLTILDANRLRLDRALAEGREALELARGLDDEDIRALALDGLKLAELKLGELDDFERHCDELVQIHRRSGDAFYLSWALLESAQGRLATGELDAALARAEEALELNRKLGDRSNRPLFLDTLAWVHRGRGDSDLALEAGRGARALAGEAGSGEWEGWTSATLGWILLEQGSVAEAVALLEEGAEAARRDEATGEVLRCSAELAWATWLLGDHDRSLALAREAQAMLEEITTPPGGAWLWGCHAQVALASVWLESGDPVAAARVVRPVMDAAERRGWHEAFELAAAVAARCEEDPAAAGSAE